MCGPIVAAASATADASSVLVVTAVMLPVALPRPVSVRGRSLVDVVGEVEEVDVARRLAHSGQQHRRVAQLLLRMRVDVQQVVPERKAFLRRRARLEVVDRRELLVVESREPGAHLLLVAANVNAGSCGERRASAAIAMRSRSSSSCTSSPRFIARMYARSSASPSRGRPSSARRACRPRRPESFETTIRRASQPTDCGVMISYVPGSLMTPSW